MLAHYAAQEHSRVSSDSGNLLHPLRTAIVVPAGALQGVQRWSALITGT